MNRCLPLILVLLALAAAACVAHDPIHAAEKAQDSYQACLEANTAQPELCDDEKSTAVDRWREYGEAEREMESE